MRTTMKLGDRLLARLVPRARAAASCPPNNRPPGCSWQKCSCKLSGGRLYCSYRCCYSSPPPQSCGSCSYSCIA